MSDEIEFESELTICFGRVLTEEEKKKIERMLDAVDVDDLLTSTSWNDEKEL